MSRRITIGCMWCLALFLLASPLHADGEFDKRASWSMPSPEAVRQQLDQWLKDYSIDELTRAKIDVLWPQEGGPTDPAAILDQLVTTMALVDADARELVVFCTGDGGLPREFAFLVDEQKGGWIRHNARLYYGRWLAQNRFYDEALVQLDGLKTAEVIDPAMLVALIGAGSRRSVRSRRSAGIHPAISRRR